MDVAQLKTLIHVAELGSLSKAAERLHIAQPALSRQIRLLEQELGTFLFERHGRGMVITQAGKDVLEHARKIMDELQLIYRSTSADRSILRGRVAIGMTPTVEQIVTVPLVRRLRELHPKLSVRVLSGFSGYLIDWLQRGEIELAVTYNPQPARSLRIEPIMIENLFLVGAAGRKLNLNTPVPFFDLEKEELVLPSPSHGLRGIVEAAARDAKIELRASVEVDSFPSMIDLVQGGLGMTILPLAPIYRMVEQGLVTAAPLVDPTPSRKMVVAYAADRPTTPEVRFVSDMLVEIAVDLVERGVWSGQLAEAGNPI